MAVEMSPGRMTEHKDRLKRTSRLSRVVWRTSSVYPMLNTRWIRGDVVNQCHCLNAEYIRETLRSYGPLWTQEIWRGTEESCDALQIRVVRGWSEGDFESSYPELKKKKGGDGYDLRTTTDVWGKTCAYLRTFHAQWMRAKLDETDSRSTHCHERCKEVDVTVYQRRVYEG